MLKKTQLLILITVIFVLMIGSSTTNTITPEPTNITRLGV